MKALYDEIRRLFPEILGLDIEVDADDATMFGMTTEFLRVLRDSAVNRERCSVQHML